MKQKEINKKSDEDLLKFKKDLELDLAKASGGSETVKNKEAKIISKKGMAQKGIRTSLRKQLRKVIAQVNTTLSERGLLEVKHKSKRRDRRLRGRMK